MAKYIRTKDGIIYVGDLIKDDYGNYCDPKNYETDIEVSNEYIIKEADTIEDLCDEFRYEFDKFLKHEKCWQDKNTGMWYDSDNDTALNEIEISTIKGGIWTDKGLIYVAKIK